MPVKIPCGQCIGCRLEKSRQWALRCSHEATLHQNNCFITLTYNDANLPDNNSLSLNHFQLFMKRLRKKYGSNIRFYHCGEYGDLNQRPHYHALLFNHDFNDKIHYKTSNENKYYISDSLSTLWPYGFSVVGDLTFESAAYVARYCLKKITGKSADEHYGDLKPEYATMSRRPGIGQGWFQKFKSSVYPSDFIVKDGQKMKPPKYYDRQLEIIDEKEIRKIKSLRIQSSKKHSKDNTPARLATREIVQRKRAERLIRGMENEK